MLQYNYVVLHITYIHAKLLDNKYIFKLMVTLHLNNVTNYREP